MPDVITDCAEPSPQEIVAALHAEIAALSPGHAALVAEYEALPRTPAGTAPAPCCRYEVHAGAHGHVRAVAGIWPRQEGGGAADRHRRPHRQPVRAGHRRRETGGAG